MDLLQIASSSGHFLQILHVINYKFNYAAPFSLSKLLQSWFYPSASLFDLFVSFLCLRLFSISFTCPGHASDPVKCKAWFLFCDYLSLLFIEDVLLYFAVFRIVEGVSHPHYCHD